MAFNRLSSSSPSPSPSPPPSMPFSSCCFFVFRSVCVCGIMCLYIINSRQLVEFWEDENDSRSVKVYVDCQILSLYKACTRQNVSPRANAWGRQPRFHHTLHSITQPRIWTPCNKVLKLCCRREVSAISYPFGSERGWPSNFINNFHISFAYITFLFNAINQSINSSI